MVHACSPSSSQRSEAARKPVRLLTEIPKPGGREDKRVFRVPFQIGSRMKGSPMLLPVSVPMLAVKIVSTPLHPSSSDSRSFGGEPLILEIAVHVNPFRHFHRVKKAVAIVLIEESSNPIASFDSRPLVVRCANGQRAPTPKRIRR